MKKRSLKIVQHILQKKMTYCCCNCRISSEEPIYDSERKLEKPKRLILDGSSMKPHDLVLCERGEYYLEVSYITVSIIKKI